MSVVADRGRGVAVDEASLRARLESFRRRHGVPGAVACLFDRAGPVVTVASGRLGAGLPGTSAYAVREDTAFRAYSVAKLVTATLICALAADGTLELSAPVGEYLPELRLRHGADPGAITLRHLLGHTSGLPPDRVEAAGSRGGARDLGRATLAEVRRLPRVGEPGEVFSYSNAGTSLAGHVAERVTGRPFAGLARERLFAPLGMAASTFALTAPEPRLRHHPPSPSDPPAAHARHVPAALCFTTAPDLARLGALHLRQGAGHDTADPLSGIGGVARAHRPVADIPVEVDLAYGLGTLLTRRGGLRVVGHEGFHAGMWCKLLAIPELGAGLVWADNRGAELRAARYEVIDAILAEHGVAPPDRRPGTGWLPAAAVAGRYWRVGAAPVDVDATGADDLLATCGGHRVPLRRAAPDVWAAPHSGTGLAAPPWTPHMDSRAITAGFRSTGPETAHLHLNGLPYRRTAAATTGPARLGGSDGG
ncbi:serine hydrolase [Sphaerisporangium krabiense]|uniref:CubicO group peptidase (Beta-lactamase class C family) n=1 Tax=Sphaerisporangium krabiense TaxID=763782 RepID=A0A7W8Z6H8_9ACTN|nr:serine hydrolase domain-containing protein [Sphaerisporangium krabiense]MBB5628301.1 CubicO group peptidase (beta-lactamase class C family) [Sphaerisporangium krabiense]GII66298.1 serine hydrolase [Sphaerisporangium krabiense]